MSYIYRERERTVTLTSNAGTILLGVEILLGRLRLWWIQLGTLWRRRTGTCGTWWHRQHRSGANQTHGRAGAWSHHKWTALIEEGRYDLEMISVFFLFFILYKVVVYVYVLLLLFFYRVRCWFCCFVFCGYKAILFFVLCRKRKEKKYNVLGQVVG